MNERTLHMLESRIRDAVAEAIHSELNDPRVEEAFPSITRVKLAPDMSVVHVSISIMGEEGAQRSCWRGLQSGRKRLQGAIGKRLKTRTVPELLLHLDESLKKAASVLDTIEKVAPEPSADAAEASDEPTEDRG